MFNDTAFNVAIFQISKSNIRATLGRRPTMTAVYSPEQKKMMTDVSIFCAA